VRYLGSVFLKLGRPTKLTFKHRHEKTSSKILADRRRRCFNCGSDYLKNVTRGEKEGNKFCSRNCYHKFVRAEEKPVFSKISFPSCRWCKRLFTFNGKGRRLHCSDRCCKDEGAFELRKSMLAERIKARPPEKACESCLVEFTPLLRERAACCSAKCAIRLGRKKGKYKRKARIRSVEHEPISRVKVFESFNWTCPCCLCPTPKWSIGTTHSKAPELDHMVPLSRGGAHTRANVQLLCRSCNGLKSDMTFEEFMDAVAKLAGQKEGDGWVGLVPMEAGGGLKS
jgi:5-methylcytosine-specific restriction endonuclease McrA